jgi:hypothetical protein
LLQPRHHPRNLLRADNAFVRSFGMVRFQDLEVLSGKVKKLIDHRCGRIEVER